MGQFRLCRWQWNAVKYRNDQGVLVDGRWRWLIKLDPPGAVPPSRVRYVRPDEPDRICNRKITKKQRDSLLAKRRSQRVVRMSPYEAIDAASKLFDKRPGLPEMIYGKNHNG